MNQLFINGLERKLNFKQGSTFENFYKTFKEDAQKNGLLISSVSINGQEVAEADLETMNHLLLSEIERCDMMTCHPRELADDTLQTLKPYTLKLAELCRDTALITNAHSFEIEFQNLIEGIQTMTESLLVVRSVLSLDAMEEFKVHEKAMCSYLGQLLEAHRLNDPTRRRTLLQDQLAKNLEAWATQVIPLMIRRTDS